MEKPTPILRLVRGRLVWWLELRSWDLGQYTLRTPAVDDEGHRIAAVHEAYEVLMRERTAAELATRQLDLLETGPTVDRVIDDWLVDRAEERGEPNDRYITNCADRCRRRWKGAPIRRLSGRQGTELLRTWRDEQAAENYAPKTRRNTFGVMMLVLRFARGLGLVAELPDKPLVCLKSRGETLASPEQPTITEADFRAIREEMFHGEALPGNFTAAEAQLYVAARRLYASFGFYTGMRVKDLDALDVGSVSADLGNFRRVSSKNKAPVRVFPVPEMLAHDMQEALGVLGRAWRPREKICGGRWPSGVRVLESAAARVGVPLPVNFRSVFRRSTVRELALRGWSERDCADYLGHADTKMIHEVYLTTPEQWRSPVKIPWDRASAVAFMGKAWTSRAQVLPFAAAPREKSAQCGGLKLHQGGRPPPDSK